MRNFLLACFILLSSAYSFAHPLVDQEKDDFGVRRVGTLNLQWKDVRTGADGNEGVLF